EQALAATASARIAIDTPRVDGSIALAGARFDDLSLKDYRRTTERDSPEVTLLSPFGSPSAQDAFFGWEMQSGVDVSTLADDSSSWTAPTGARLSPDTPVTLTLIPGPGLRIERTISIDNNFMFTITDVVRNERDSAVSVRPLGVTRREGLPPDYVRNQIVHQGLLGFFGPETRRHATSFEDAQKHARNRERGRVGRDQRIVEQEGQGGWFGVTDHYWLTAIVPEQSEQVSAYFNSRAGADATDFRAAYRGVWHEAPAGGEVSYTQRLFAGAKQVDVLREYQSALAIPRLDDAVDWGNFWFLTRPYFIWLMHPLAKWAGSFGIGILLTTIVIKLLMFPLVYQSFKAMARMRTLQPKMKEIQERYAADKQRQQQETLKLYQTEKINPVSGCVPILLQIPVFYALYKVLTNTIEMRHTPFYGWIQDLSAPDPTSIFNLFGILPAIGFDFHSIPLVGALIPALGVWPIFYGVTMWALQALSPPPADPMQAAIFRWMPLLFTFMFAGFAAGLVIYWTWSNILSLIQQYVIMRRQGVETQFDKLLAKWRAPAAAE
ncbi:MAG TPA: membrane protein insertase YidC, partial [Hyphomonadaceae bacterium]|nr:membrane protein insertase YidC [Hyphomonadaceae bacterium]